MEKCLLEIQTGDETINLFFLLNVMSTNSSYLVIEMWSKELQQETGWLKVLMYLHL